LAGHHSVDEADGFGLSEAARIALRQQFENPTNQLSPQPSDADVDVLVVDDDEALRNSWAQILDRFGYSVAAAPDGDVALEFLSERNAGVVLLDLRMPRRDGLSVLEALSTPQLVVLVSAYSLDEAAQARAKGKVVTYLEKPIPPGQLLDVVATTLGRR
jgi:CheY-like chemotaxis protein